ncbi:hypothetical protein FHP25_00460 [Vineibacter terrae]|uniref:Uncharacterized protein n=1 Tax=Vineibacter terrae TaxID=2586908 RepID=A0A5C8PVF8_9HYPH|nr:hypothetical protein [Vineibacter terrae]TXL82207.1 hypothetical protein FHP25_00460 [Vineibacter terrae]
MRIATLSAVLVVLGAGTAAAQQQPSLDRSSDMLDTMTRRLKLCAEITDTAARLTCYDRVESGGSAPTPTPTPTPQAGPAPAPQAAPPPPTPAPPPRSPAAAPPSAVTSQPIAPPDPSRVGQDDKPVAPEDRAFDPRTQGRGGPGTTIGAAPGVVLPGQGPSTVEPQWRRIGAVPIRSAPGTQVPVVTLELPGLRPGPDYRWQLSMALANNTARTFDVTIACAFNNGDRKVSDMTIILRNVRGGEKVGADIAGPPTNQFVDNAPCHVISPLQ